MSALDRNALFDSRTMNHRCPAHGFDHFRSSIPNAKCLETSVGPILASIRLVLVRRRSRDIDSRLETDSDT